MAKTKEKIEQDKKPQAKVSSKLDIKKGIPDSIWQKEIEALQSKKFSNVEEASKEVIARVVERVGGNAESRTKMQEFLLDVIETDPGLQEELKKVLKIG